MEGPPHEVRVALVDGRLVWHSISRYLPSPLDVLEHPWIQWCVLLPRRIDDQDDVAATAGRALQALGLRDGLSHMEWFRKADGEAVFGEIACRAAGARTTEIMNYASDIDVWTGWAEAVSVAMPARCGTCPSRCPGGTTREARSDSPWRTI